MIRFGRSLFSFGAGMAVVIAALVFGDLHQTVVAAVKATLTRDIDHAANHPFIGGLDTNFGSGATVPTTTLDGTPVKRAVIEYVAGSCNATLPKTIYEVSLGITLNTGPGSSQNAHYSFVPVQTTVAGPPGPPTNALYVFSQVVRLYADPGTNLTGGLGTNSGGGSGAEFANCSIVFSGHLVTQ
jgi:hypothetical protein